MGDVIRHDQDWFWNTWRVLPALLKVDSTRDFSVSRFLETGLPRTTSGGHPDALVGVSQRLSPHGVS